MEIQCKFHSISKAPYFMMKFVINTKLNTESASRNIGKNSMILVEKNIFIFQQIQMKPQHISIRIIQNFGFNFDLHFWQWNFDLHAFVFAQIMIILTVDEKDYGE